MSETRRRSLCCTCKDEEICIKTREFLTPVIHCELFECEQLSNQPASALRAESSASIVSVRAAIEEPCGLQGLCTNCDCRFDCGLPRPEGGVWHCEEYQ